MVKIKVYLDSGESRICHVVDNDKVVTKNKGEFVCLESELFPDGYEDEMECFIIIWRRKASHMPKYDRQAIKILVKR